MDICMLKKHATMIYACSKLISYILQHTTIGPHTGTILDNAKQ